MWDSCSPVAVDHKWFPTAPPSQPGFLAMCHRHLSRIPFESLFHSPYKKSTPCRDQFFICGGCGIRTHVRVNSPALQAGAMDQLGEPSRKSKMGLYSESIYSTEFLKNIQPQLKTGYNTGFFYSIFPISTIVLITVSGFNEMESMPSFTKNSAKSTKSEGACPQIPTFRFA